MIWDRLCLKTQCLKLFDLMKTLLLFCYNCNDNLGILEDAVWSPNWIDPLDIENPELNDLKAHIAKDCLLTLVKSRLALGSPGCSFVRDHAENGPIMVVACPLVITSKVKFFFRPNKTRKGEWMVQPVFCIVDTVSCFYNFLHRQLLLCSFIF